MMDWKIMLYGNSARAIGMREGSILGSAAQRLCVAVCAVLAQGAAGVGGEPIPCLWSFDSIDVDGAADDGAWLTEGMNTGSSGDPMLLAAWDRSDLYLLVRVQANGDDGGIEFLIRPAADRPGAYRIRVDGDGQVQALFWADVNAPKDAANSADGEFGIEASRVVGTANRGVTYELKIPWIDLMRTGGRAEPGEAWQIAAGPLADGAEVSRLLQSASALVFLGPGETARRRELDAPHAEPFRAATTSRVVGSPEPPLPYVVREAYPELPLDLPIDVARQPGSAHLIAVTAEGKPGHQRVVRFADDDAAEAMETLIELPWVLYSVEFHPDFVENGYLYVGGNGPIGAASEDRVTRVFRFTMPRDETSGERRRIDLASEATIIEWQSNGHDGGDMAFGRDGLMYVTSGDGTSDSDTNLTGQGLDHLLAKVLRIDVDDPADGRMYRVPEDNPFVDLAGAKSETYAYGLRNPWRIATDRQKGFVWVGNNGQDLWEQIYFVRAGDNYGWSVYEGGHPFYLERELGPTPHVPPAMDHHHSEARSLTGGVVYYGERYVDLDGAYLYGDYSTGRIWAIWHDGTEVTQHREIADTTLQITAIELDGQGRILVADHQGPGKGQLYVLTPNPHLERDAETARTFPRRLSDTGLFRSVADHEVERSLIRYDVAAPLWSDGAFKVRYIALPHADSTIDVTPSRGWNFPDGTVLVKSFGFEFVEGNPASRRWIETRLLTRHEGEWAGYSYAWNDEGTDATLVDAAGSDRTFSMEEAGGTREQSWRFPSRADCMVCHSRAANFVLGPSTLQLNHGDTSSGFGGANSLERLEALGVLRTSWRPHADAAVRAAGAERGLEGDELVAYVSRQSPVEGQRRVSPTSSLLPRDPAEMPHLVDPYDEDQDVSARARSYLHANCANCHVGAGGGNSAIDLEFVASVEKQQAIEVTPLHDRFGIEDARIVAAGDPNRSVLLHRVSTRGRGQMPPLATSRVDDEAVQLLARWISGIERPDTCGSLEN